MTKYSTHIYAPSRPFEEQFLYNIDEFPREFKKKWTASLDVRYTLIWLATFVSTVSFILFMQHHIRNIVLDTQVRSFHDNFAQLILEDIPEPLSTVSPSVGTRLYGISEPEPAPPSINSIIATDSRLTEAPTTSDVSTEVLVDGKSHRYQTLQPQALPEPANNRLADDVGLLGIIASGSANDNSDIDLSDIIDSNESSSEQLYASLSAIIEANNTLHTNGNGEGTKYQLRHQPPIARASYQSVIDEMNQKEQVTYQDIERNSEMESITESELLNTVPKNHQKMRSPEQVTAVILSHNQSIQDCYKQILKRRPSVKGKIVLRFSVTTAGTIRKVEIIQSTLNDRQLENCIIRRVKRWNDFGPCDPVIGDVTYRQTYVFGY